MNIAATSLKTASACTSPGIPERAQGLRKLQQSIESNLATFRPYSANSTLGTTYWFSNEVPYATSVREAVRLDDSFAQLPTSKPLSGYHIAIITGEGGLFQGLPELAAACDLTLQVDRDPRPLQLSALLLEECKKTEKYPENDSEKMAVLTRAIDRLQEADPECNAEDAEAIAGQFKIYITGMKRNLFSSADRFVEFKRCQDHPVQQVCLDYFSEEAMTALTDTLKDHDASVRFLNISNVCEYPKEFYQAIPYDGAKINITPCQYILQLPFSEDAICAYSQLFGYRLFTATATVPEMADALHANSISGRNRDLRALARTNDDMQLYTRLLQVSSLDGASARELEQVTLYCLTYGPGPTHQLLTRIFQFFAKYPIAAEDEWILRMAAFRLTSSEVEELKAHKEALKSDYLKSHPTSLSAKPPLFPGRLHQMYGSASITKNEDELPDINPPSISGANISKAGSSEKRIKRDDNTSEATTLPLFLEILDKITAEPTPAERNQPL